MARPRLNEPPATEPLDDEERMLMDPATWDWDSIQEVTPEPSGYSTIELRLPYDELARIEHGADRRQMTVQAFMRRAALERASTQGIHPELNLELSPSAGEGLLTWQAKTKEAVGFEMSGEEAELLLKIFLSCKLAWQGESIRCLKVALTVAEFDREQRAPETFGSRS